VFRWPKQWQETLVDVHVPAKHQVDLKFFGKGGEPYQRVLLARVEQNACMQAYQ
jgi:hypothetical protein